MIYIANFETWNAFEISENFIDVFCCNHDFLLSRKIGWYWERSFFQVFFHIMLIIDQKKSIYKLVLDGSQFHKKTVFSKQFVVYVASFCVCAELFVKFRVLLHSLLFCAILFFWKLSLNKVKSNWHDKDLQVNLFSFP